METNSLKEKEEKKLERKIIQLSSPKPFRTMSKKYEYDFDLNEDEKKKEKERKEEEKKQKEKEKKQKKQKEKGSGKTPRSNVSQPKKIACKNKTK